MAHTERTFKIYSILGKNYSVHSNKEEGQILRYFNLLK